MRLLRRHLLLRWRQLRRFPVKVHLICFKALAFVVQILVHSHSLLQLFGTHARGKPVVFSGKAAFTTSGAKCCLMFLKKSRSFAFLLLKTLGLGVISFLSLLGKGKLVLRFLLRQGALPYLALCFFFFFVGVFVLKKCPSAAQHFVDAGF